MGMFDFLKRRRNGDSSEPPSPSSSEGPRELPPRRRAHYTMAHYALRFPALKDPLIVLAILASPERDKFLTDLIGRCAQDAAQTGEAPPDFTAADFTVHPMRIADYPTAIIEFPPPTGPTEVFMTAIVLMAKAGLPMEQVKQAGARYFTLELTAAGGVFLCEWTETMHANTGSGPEPTVPAFAAAIEKLVGAG